MSKTRLVMGKISTTKLLMGSMAVAGAGLAYRKLTEDKRRLKDIESVAKNTMLNLQSQEKLIAKLNQFQPRTLNEMLTFWNNINLNEHADALTDAATYGTLIRAVHANAKSVYEQTPANSEECNKAFDDIVHSILSVYAHHELHNLSDIEALLETIQANNDDSRIGLNSSTLQARVMKQFVDGDVSFFMTDKDAIMSALSNPQIDNSAKRVLLADNTLRAIAIRYIENAHDLSVFVKVGDPCCTTTASQIIRDVSKQPKIVRALRSSINELSNDELDTLFKSMKNSAMRGSPEGLTQVEFLELMDNQDLDKRVMAESKRMRAGFILSVESILHLQKKYSQPKAKKHKEEHLTSAETFARHTQHLSDADTDIEELTKMWSQLNFRQNPQLLTCKIDYALLLIEANRMAHANFDNHGYDEVEYDVFSRFGGFKKMEATNTGLKASGEKLMNVALTKIMTEFKDKEIKSAGDIVELLQLVGQDTNFFNSAWISTPHHFMDNLQSEVIKHLDIAHLELLANDPAALASLFKQRETRDSCLELLKNPIIQDSAVQTIKSAQDLEVILSAAENHTNKMEILHKLAQTPSSIEAVKKTMSLDTLKALFRTLRYDDHYHDTGSSQIAFLQAMQNQVNDFVKANAKALYNCSFHEDTKNFLNGKPVAKVQESTTSYKQ